MYKTVRMVGETGFDAPSSYKNSFYTNDKWQVWAALVAEQINAKRNFLRRILSLDVSNLRVTSDVFVYSHAQDW